MPDTFPSPPSDRYFEDYEAGRVYEFGSIAVTEGEIVEFAQRFDPQAMHIDAKAATEGRFGGLIASGWHTAGIAMRLFVDHYITHVASLASPGVDELRWPNPVRPGDTIHVRIEILEARESKTKNDRGIVRSKVEAFNQRDEPVLSMLAISIVGRRPRP